MRKYTFDWYMQYLRQYDSYMFKKEIKKYCNTVVNNIIENDKKHVAGEFIDYLGYTEGFDFVLTYRIEDMLLCAIDIRRLINGRYHHTYYSLLVNNILGGYKFVRHKFKYAYKRYVYCENLKELFNGTEYQYSQVWELGKHTDIKIRNLQYCYDSHLKAIELLTKQGLYYLARDCMNNSYSIDHLKELNKQDLELFKTNNFNGNDLVPYIKFKELNLDFKHYKSLKYFLSWKDADNFRYISFKSLFEYYLQQKKQKTVGAFYNFYCDYRDYIRFGERLKYDFENTKYTKPLNFKIAHDMAYNKYNSLQNKDLYSGVKKELTQYLKLAYKGESYSIVMPKTAEDIIKEGQEMHNCVGSYLGRIKNGQSIICFVRKNDDIKNSYCTLEINPKNLSVAQCRSKNNGMAPKDVLKFVNLWKKNILNKKYKTA